MKRFSILLFAVALPAMAEDYVEWVGANSGVNWSSGTIQAEGAGAAPANAPPSTGRMMACRAAVVDAQRNLLESIQGVRVEGTTVVANMMVESDIIKTTVNGVLQGAQVIKRDPRDDGSCFVEMSAPMGGKLTTEIYDQVFSPDQSTANVRFESLYRLVGNSLDFLVAPAYAAEPRRPAGSDWQSAIDNLAGRISTIEALVSRHPAVIEATSSGPTGLVLDARGSSFIPSMSPKIRQLRAGVIYPNEAHQVTRRDRGQLVSLFTRDVDTALRHPVVGERPLVLKGLRTFGDTRTEIVIDADAGERLEKLVNAGFLGDAGVIIVL